MEASDVETRERHVDLDGVRRLLWPTSIAATL